MPPWLPWVFIGVLALAGEAASMALFLLYVGVAAFVAAALAFFGFTLVPQIGVFAVLSILLLGLVRPRMLHVLTGRVPTHTLTNQGALIDRVATVTQAVTRDGGTIRIGSGEFWTARANPPADKIPAGSRVRIAYVDGLTAYVDPVPALDDASSMSDTSEAPLAPGVPLSSEMAREEK